MNMMDDTSGRETSATRAAYLSLRQMILTGALPAGQKLKIENLRKLLDTGASPVREALSLLTSDMLRSSNDTERAKRSARQSVQESAAFSNLYISTHTHTHPHNLRCGEGKGRLRDGQRMCRGYGEYMGICRDTQD